MAGHVAGEEDDLAADDEGEVAAGGGQSDGGPEPVAVDGGVDECGGENGKDLKGLGEFEPEERYEGEDGVVEELGDGEAAPPDDGEKGAEHVEEAGEVVEVGPEEDAAGGAGAEGEAEEPLEGGGPGAAPEPPGVADLGGG